jgi:site-specific recombinase XerD
MGKRIPTMDYQVYSAIQEINLTDDIEKRTDIYNELTESNLDRVGKSEFKRAGIAEKFIFSHNGVKNSMTQAKAFANWCKSEYGVKFLNQITPEMGRSFLEHKQAEGVSPSTLKTYKFSMSKLDSGIQEKFNAEGFYNQEVKGFSTGSREYSERLYTNEQVLQIVEGAAGTKFEQAFQVQFALGLRVHELVKLRAEDIKADHVEVIGKGGLLREVPILDQHRPLIESIGFSISEGKVFPDISVNGYQKAMHRITGKLGFEQSYKTHEIRKAFASNLLEELKEQDPEGNQRDMNNYVCRILGHGDDRHDLWKIYLAG